MSGWNRRQSLSISVLAGVLITALIAPGTLAGTGPLRIATDKPESPKVVQILLDDRAELDRLVDTGTDVVEYVNETPDGLITEVVVTPSELARLHAMGFESGEVVFTMADWRSNLAERARYFEDQGPLEDAGVADTVKILRADYYDSNGARFLNVEAKSSLGNATALQMVAIFDNVDSPTTLAVPATLSAFVDAGAYMYHRALIPVEGRATTLTVQSSRGGTATSLVTEWLGQEPPAVPDTYHQDFIDHYMDPTEVYAKIDALAAEFPAISEIIELPNETNGYRRKAQRLLGSSSAAGSAVVVTSAAWGSEGGNDLSIQVINPGTPDAPLSASVAESLITVSLATDATGVATSTATQVAEALRSGSEGLVTAHTYRGNAGSGLVSIQTPIALTDSLDAPEEISRDPWQPRVLRIGAHRDGSKLGVFAYAQEHAREWVTPLVAVETAERLLRNYATDPATQELVDNLDIFILPSVNPDGSHYSFHDFGMQRRNMTNHCAENNSDPGRVNSWGVDNNRNYQVGSIFDGFSGASSSCTSDTYSGPAEHSEPESRNVAWVADTFTNIKYSMNIHSHGGYFMWAPGAYKSSGRESLPPPPLDVEAAFWGGAAHILQAIKDYRGTVIKPGRTGPIADVLYSAAGNSADELYYDNGIFGWSFEVGAELWNPTTRSWSSVGFQPEFDNEGHDEAMEFSNGLVAMLEVALDYSRDAVAPTSELVARGANWIFTTGEPAAVYYTIDGSAPTFESDRYDRGGIREGGKHLSIPSGATVKWFSVDTAGNIEGDYDPSTGAGYRQQAV